MLNNMRRGMGGAAGTCSRNEQHTSGHDRDGPRQGRQANEDRRDHRRLLASGYVSSSANFRGIVNQTLIKDKRFRRVARGVYGLKVAGKSEGSKATAA